MGLQQRPPQTQSKATGESQIPPQLNNNPQASDLNKIYAIFEALKPSQAGQLKNCVNERTTVNSEPFILQCITNCVIEFQSTPISQHLGIGTNPECRFSPIEQVIIDTEIEDFVRHEVIETCDTVEGQVISTIFIRPKEDSNQFRVIFNLKLLNQSIVYHKFKMDTPEAAIKLMKPG